MKVAGAVAFWLENQKSNSRKNTIRGYEVILSKFCRQFLDRNLDEINSNEVLSFPNQVTGNRKQHTNASLVVSLIHWLIQKW